MNENARKMGSWMWVCVALAAAAVMAIAVSVSGTWIILPLIGCLAMLGMMMWMMMGTGHRGEKK